MSIPRKEKGTLVLQPSSAFVPESPQFSFSNNQIILWPYILLYIFGCLVSIVIFVLCMLCNS